MSENNNHLIAALNACIEDLVAKAIEKQLTKHIDDYIATSPTFESRVLYITDLDTKADKFDESVKEVVRNMTFSIEVARY